MRCINPQSTGGRGHELSRMISDLRHMPTACIITDGGGRHPMTTEERAKDLRQSPIYILGAASAQTHWTQ